MMDILGSFLNSMPSRCDLKLCIPDSHWCEACAGLRNTREHKVEWVCTKHTLLSANDPPVGSDLQEFATHDYSMGRSWWMMGQCGKMNQLIDTGQEENHSCYPFTECWIRIIQTWSHRAERQYEIPSSAFVWNCGGAPLWDRYRNGATVAVATYVICGYRHHAPALLHPSGGKQLLRGLLLLGAALLTADST